MARRKEEHKVPPAVTYIAAGTSFVSVGSGLLFYFGAVHESVYWEHLGVNESLLSQPPESYLRAGALGLLRPIVVVAAALLVAVWLHRILQPALTHRYGRRERKVVAVAAAVIGIGTLLVGVLNMLDVPLLRFDLAFPPLCLIVGVSLLVYASRAHRKLRASKRIQTRGAIEAAGAFALIVVGLFWGVNEYSAKVGIQNAEVHAAALPYVPDTVMYSAQDLNINTDGVSVTRCGGGESAYRFRYDGLKLIRRSGDVLVFLPDGWTRTDGPAVVIPRIDSIRFEFRVAEAAGGTPSDDRPSC